MAFEPVGGWDHGGGRVAPLARWVADEQVRTSRAERVMEASLCHQAADASRWRGLMLDLAERGALVELALRTGPAHGTITAVGDDFCVLERAHRRELIALAAIGQVCAADELPWGFRGVPPAASMAEVLCELSRDRPVVRVRSTIGPERTGRLERAGHDVVTISTDHPATRSVSINLAVVDAVTLSR